VTQVFVPGLELNGAFYREAVAPVLAGRPHAAALLGWGSDVLGYDTERSTDHGWGPRLLLFMHDREEARQWVTRLDRDLPQEFRGWPVRFGWDGLPTRHWVTVTTLSAWAVDHLGIDATKGLSALDWLSTPQQQLLGVVAGAVYADHDGALTALREDLAWYPDQVWYWLIACQWRRIAQEEAFVARNTEVGDETGSAITAVRQAREVMRLTLLLQKRYAPYHKWLGTAFARSTQDDDLVAQLHAVVHAPNPEHRQDALAAAYQSLAHRHNALGITPVLDPEVRRYHARPARVLMAERFVEATIALVEDPWLRGLPLIGAVDQFVDSTQALQDPALWRRFAAVYEPITEDAAQVQR
jgi:Holliday junction resolvasome RuvABC endonuclease subunit